MVLGDEDRGALLLEINGDLIVKKGKWIVLRPKVPREKHRRRGDKTIVVKTTRRLKRRTICIGRGWHPKRRLSIPHIFHDFKTIE